MSGLQTVHVRVNDAATRQPTPCRIRFTDANGVYHAPLGRLIRFATEVGVDVGGNVLLDGRAYAYIDGTCEIRIPPGRVSLTITKGPEYRPVQTDFVVPPGKLALRFELERWTDLRADGWYSGDTRCHFLSPHAALLEAAAEDLAVVNLLCREAPAFGAEKKDTRALANFLAFSGQRPVVEMPSHMVVVNTLNEHPTLGQLLLLNCHRVVYPLTFGGPDRFDDWTLTDWCDQCHRKAGLVIGEDFFGKAAGDPHGELLADVILGKVDALNLDSLNFDLHEWHWLLDLGFRMPLTAGSGKDCNRHALGTMRTYARLIPGEDISYKNWIEAVRAGRTFVTSGPLLMFTVNDQDPGTVIDLPAEGSPIRLRAEARSLAPLDAVEIMANGCIIASSKPERSPILETEVPMPASGWLTAHCWGPEGEALTSPVYVRVEGRRPPADSKIIGSFIGYLERMVEWVACEGRFENDAQRQRLGMILKNARNRLGQE